MKKNLILAGCILILTVGFWFYFKKVIEPQPARIVQLQKDIAEKKRQLLSAQIIHTNMKNVTELIQNNLVENLSDSLAQAASIPFLQYLTGLMDKYKIVLVSMRPLSVVKKDRYDDENTIDQDYIEIPYNMEILASYQEFGKFLQELERNPRLIKLTRLQVDNPIDAGLFSGEITGKPDQHRMNLEVQTITILKESFISGSE